MTEQDFPDPNNVFFEPWNHLTSDPPVVSEGPAALSSSSRILFTEDKTDYLIINLHQGRTIRADLNKLTSPRKVENKASAPYSSRGDNFTAEVPFLPLLPSSVDYIKNLRRQGWKLSYGDMSEILLQIQAVRNPGTVFHQRRVEVAARALAQRLGYQGEALEEVCLAAKLHDIGKDGIPDEVLGKNGPLDPEERDIMDKHPLLSAAILQALNFPKFVVEAVRQHHKEPSGKGYPTSLPSEEVNLEGQIVRMVDQCDAAVTEQRGYPKEVKTVAELWQEFVVGVRYKRYWPGVVRAIKDTYEARAEEWEALQRDVQPQHSLVAS